MTSMSMPIGQIAKNLRAVRERIAEACLRVARDPREVTLVAVTKTFPLCYIQEAWEAGQRDFGENRPEEGAPKIEAMTRWLAEQEGGGATGCCRPTWHMIGHVQRRKAGLVVAHFDLVHSVDRLKLAQKLSRLALEADRQLPVLIECNVSGEVTKYGYQLAGWQERPELLQSFVEEMAGLVALSGLEVMGLMTVAPWLDDPEMVRPVFASLRALRDALQERLPGASWQHLSMGMSDDFEVAVEEGATMVRLGRAIFGPRPVSPGA